tara:strand:+ start:203 stop:754 length:552 start_codon:yes stop_codon:yes gene_type:complete
MQQQTPLPIAYPLTVISGGQTGADIGGLVAAQACKIPTTGYTTKGCRTERGPQPILLSKFNLVEHTESGYDKRTIENASVADVTIVFATNPDSAGTKLTIKSALDAYKGYFLVVDFSNEEKLKLLSFLNAMQPNIINIAGNRESVSPGISEKVRDILKFVLPRYKHNLNELIKMEKADEQKHD